MKKNTSKKKPKDKAIQREIDRGKNTIQGCALVWSYINNTVHREIKIKKIKNEMTKWKYMTFPFPPNDDANIPACMPTLDDEMNKNARPCLHDDDDNMP